MNELHIRGLYNVFLSNHTKVRVKGNDVWIENDEGGGKVGGFYRHDTFTCILYDYAVERE